MKNNILLHTNLIVCIIITIGFILTSVIGYCSNTAIFEKDVEHVSVLASEGIYYQIDKIFSESINVSLTMANDSLLKSFLADDEKQFENETNIKELQDYLYAYREKYDYDSVFLFSEESNQYYHFDGLNGVLVSEYSENRWYYEFLKGHDEYSLNIDNDEATDNSITAFVNCKIRDKDGAVLGVIGVGVNVDSIQCLLKEYNEKFNITASLVDAQGIVQISSERTGYEQVSLFDDNNTLAKFGDTILGTQEEQEAFWYNSVKMKGYVVVQYVQSLKWHLIVENDMTAMNRKLNIQLYQGGGIIAVIILFVFFTITDVLKQYRTQITKFGSSQREEYKKLLEKATEGLYESIFEIDVTNNKASGDSVNRYFSELGMGINTPYDEALRTVATMQIKEEYAQGYLDTFLPEHVMEAYSKGISNLGYDFLIANDGNGYHWMRIFCQIFYWPSDGSVRMISYRKNIDEEKKRELSLLEQSRRDAMTGLYNKGTTENMINCRLSCDLKTDKIHAFIGFDIDDFKNINDKYGHAFGDMVIKGFSDEIKIQFRDSDIVGRIGGDEFAVLMLDCGNISILKEKLNRFCANITKKNYGLEVDEQISSSIGVAFYPEQGKTYEELFEKVDGAVYYAKAHGKSTFHILGTTEETDLSSRLDARDIRTVLENTTDGIAKYAYTTRLKLLFFNKKLANLVGSEIELLDSEGFDPFDYVHPKELKRLQEALQAALPNKTPIDETFWLKHKKGHYFLVRLQGHFVNELYLGEYPVFYGIYTDLMFFMKEGVIREID